MYLKKVEILGFKSFANKTVLEFFSPEQKQDKVAVKENQITAIVGPNGSGKSNVSDAIKWAIGEQSMKTLRGKKSEDVIFAGSPNKTRMSSAQVSLHFDNSDKRIPLEFSEVVITRKFFRSGESEYLINGSRARLLDVSELLAKAGIGKDSYCVINQGMSDAVLHATPAERKTILEDAAGVKQFQIRKHRALKKLENARENMERIIGLTQEIEPHLKLLKRQAEKAEQGKQLIQLLREKQEKFFAYLWHLFEQEKKSFTGEREKIEQELEKLQAKLDEANQNLNKEAREIEDEKQREELERKKSQLIQKVNEIERELIVLDGRLVVEKERLANQKSYKIIPVDLRYVQEKLSKIRQDQKSLIERIQKVEQLSQLQDIREFAQAINQEIFDLHNQSGQGKVKVAMDNSAQVQKIQDQISEYEKRKNEFRQIFEQNQKLIKEVEAEIEQEIARNRKAREHFFQLEKEVRDRQNQLSQTKDKFNDIKIRLARIEVREEDLVGEIDQQLHCQVQSLQYDGKEIDRDKSEKEISSLKLRLEQIGGIDPLVMEEYQETKGRFEFLTGELADLEEAIKSLQSVVKEMDQKIEVQFSDAFEEINREFKKYFQIIFGGGRADLVKIKIKKNTKKEGAQSENENQDGSTETMAESSDEEDLEENSQKENELGIEIMACPPGKKITNLAMLSGGERALTSLALLFAIIAHNPPPFAILDEVEAALDEANSRRFSKILGELSQKTQFIAITHNRETMRQASLLYGVTMGEDGVSKLLSVHLDQIGQGGKVLAK